MNDQEFERYIGKLFAAAKKPAPQPDPYGGDTDVDRASGLEHAGEVSRFGPYEVGDEIGRGGFGLVLLARDTRNGEAVALKLPMPHVLMSLRARRRFHREGRVGEKLYHPGIVKVRDAGEIGGIAYIASDYVPGPTLAQWLENRQTPVSPRQAAMLVARLADALAHAHSEQVIHRDLKPSNIILRHIAGGADPGASGDGCPFQPCVTDFGLAKVLDEIRDEHTLTGSAEIGSTAFMAPEQALGQSEAIGPGTDIHALGVILFRILSGKTPFVGSSHEEILRKIAHENPKPLRAIRADVPEQLEIICDKCLRKNPRQRYASARELKADLERYLASERILARPISFMEKSGRWARRHPAITGVVLSSFMFMTVTIVVQALANRQLNRTNQELIKSRQREQEQTLQAEARRAIVERAFDEIRIQSANTVQEQGRGERAQRMLLAIDPGPSRGSFAWKHVMLRASETLEVLAMENDIHRMTVSPDGAKVANCGDEGFVRVREMATGRELERYPVDGRFSQDLAFSRTGDRLFSLTIDLDKPRADGKRWSSFESRENGTTRRVSLPTNADRIVESATGDRLRFTDFDPASALWSVRFVRVSDMSVDQEPDTTSTIRPRLFPDGRHAVVADLAGALRLKALEGTPLDRAIARVADILPESVAMHPRLPRLSWLENTATGRKLRISSTDPDEDRTVDIRFPAEYCTLIDGDERILIYDQAWKPVLCDPRNGKFLTLQANPDLSQAANRLATVDLPQSFAFGSRIVTYGYRLGEGGHTNQLWDGDSGMELPFPGEEAIGVPQWMPDGKSVLFSSRSLLKRWWPEGRSRATRALPGHKAEVWDACFAPDDSILVTGSDDADESMTLRIWDWKNGELIRGFKPHEATVSCVGISPDGTTMVTSALARENNLSLWNLKTGQKIQDLSGHTTSIYALAFSPDGKILASGDRSGRVIIWDVPRGQAIASFNADLNKIRGLSFLPGSDMMVATASESRRTRIWNVSTAKIVRQWSTSHEFTSLAFASGKPWLCTAEQGGRIYVWDIETGNRVRLIDIDSDRLVSLRFLPNSTMLAAGDKEGRLHIIDVETGIETLKIKGHEDQINSVACTSDGMTLVTVAHDGSVRIWFEDESR